MANMLILSPAASRKVFDYDFLFDSGSSMALTIDPAAGDHVQWGGATIEIELAAKPTQNDPNQLTAPETITLFVPHVVSVQKREREQLSLTAEQREAWVRTIEELTIQ